MPYQPTAANLLAIRNTLSNYPIALDTKDFALLHKVFAPSIECDYTAVTPQYPTISGLDTFLDRIQIILKDKTTQHALSTQRLEFEELEGRLVCNAVTYFTANTFTTEEDGGLGHVSVFGMYEDELCLVGDGQWRIFKRTVKTFHPRIKNSSAIAPKH